MLNFDHTLKLEFHGTKVTSDGGLLAYRELDEALALTKVGADLLTDSRLGSNKQHLLVPLLRQSIYSRLAGYEDVNDAERLAVDPAMRHVVGGRAAQADKEAA
ncbi:MAG: transposase, partial [Planctomycetota bacterium]